MKLKENYDVMMNYKGTLLHVELLSNGREARLTSPFMVIVLDKIICVPKGFVTDFASSPWWAWSVVPPWGKYSPAAVVHDYLYKYKLLYRRKCDKIFLEMMKVLKVKKWRRSLMYTAVRSGGWYRYGKGRK